MFLVIFRSLLGFVHLLKLKLFIYFSDVFFQLNPSLILHDFICSSLWLLLFGIENMLCLYSTNVAFLELGDFTGPRSGTTSLSIARGWG